MTLPKFKLPNCLLVKSKSNKIYFEHYQKKNFFLSEKVTFNHIEVYEFQYTAYYIKVLVSFLASSPVTSKVSNIFLSLS